MNRELTSETTSTSPTSESSDLPNGQSSLNNHRHIQYISANPQGNTNSEQSQAGPNSDSLRTDSNIHYAVGNEPSLFPIVSFPHELSPESIRRVHDETLEIINRGVEEQRRLRNRHNQPLEGGSTSETLPAESEEETQ